MQMRAGFDILFPAIINIARHVQTELRERHLTRQYNCRPYNISLVVCNCYSLRSMETKGKYLDRMTWPEAEKALETTTVIIVPVGARTKEHGYHLQLNNDYLTAEYMTKAILDRCDNVLAVPTVQYGYYPAFVNFPGSINISRAVFRDMIVDICASMHRHKPSLRFYIQNGGISTNYSLEPARKILAEKGIIMEFTDLFVAGTSLSDWVYFCYCGVLSGKEETAKHETQECGTHADEIETSMMLVMAPDTVKLERAEKACHPNTPGPFVRTEAEAASGLGMYSPSGVWGDPTLASIEKGIPIVAAVVDYHLSRIAALKEADYVPQPYNERYLGPHKGYDSGI
jgi:creatinine amidohydrolase